MTRYVCPRCFRDGKAPSKPPMSLFVCDYCHIASELQRAIDLGAQRDLGEKEDSNRRLAAQHLPEQVRGVASTDCRSDEGITVGLIDTIINSCRLLKQRSWSGTAILEALKDMAQDEDVKAVTSGGMFGELKAELQGAKKLLRECMGNFHRTSPMSKKIRAFIATGYKEELCEDEGCPHHGTKHVCTTRRPS